jgi:hypothetical protein
MILTFISNKYFILLVFSIVAFILVGKEMKRWLPSKEVVAFEFLNNSEAVDELINSSDWQEINSDGFNKVTRLKNNTLWDFLYILCYSSLFIFLSRLILAAIDNRIKKINFIIYCAAFADLIENIFLLSILNGSRSFYPMAMTTFAAIKFSLLILVVIWLIFFIAQKIIFFKK